MGWMRSRFDSGYSEVKDVSMNLIVYTKTGCPWCRGVTDFLKEKGVAFEERGVRENPALLAELKQKSGQDKTPTLDLDGEILADTDAAAVEVFLKKHGVLS